MGQRGTHRGSHPGPTVGLRAWRDSAFSKRGITNLLAAFGVAAAAYQIVSVKLTSGSIFAQDVYAYYFPNLLYAVHQLHEGGKGLLWNPLQNCGQPFLANSLVGLFYPPNWLFFVLDPDRALAAVLLVNLLVAGLGSYALFRQLGARYIPSLSGALAFLLGPTTIKMAGWSPIHMGSYCWLPVALLFAERLLSRPRTANVFALGTVLTLAFLPGYPQVTLFIYLMVGLRVLVQLAAGGEPRILRTLGNFAAAFALPILLGAISIFPYVELWQESFRNRVLTAADLDWKGRAQAGIDRLFVQNWRVQVSAVLGLIAVGSKHFRRPTLFFFLAGSTAVTLAFGPSGPLGSLYSAIPGIHLFRFPDRFLWLTDICCAGLIALGLDAVGRAVPMAAQRKSRVHTPVWFAGRIAAVVLIPAAVIWTVQQWEQPVSFIYHSSESLWEHEASFSELRSKMTPQDRSYLAHPHPAESEFAFMQKSASLFGVPSLFDYEPITNRRYAEFFVMMQSGRTLDRLGQFIYARLAGWFPREFRRRMLSLVGARYVVLDRLDSQPLPKPWLKPVPELSSSGSLRFYENPAAMPRAFFVGEIKVVPDPAQLLLRLANGPDRLTEVALVEEPPVSGFLGARQPARMDAVEFAVDDPEHLVLDVNAPRRGFLFLSDTYYPGWRATVNGRPAPIQRANYAFRLVEVPKGRSTVTFRFRPISLILGAGISLASVLAMAVALRWSRSRRRSV